MRINRFLASAGLGSRRSCEELILTSQVTINGVLCENLASNVEPTDVVKVGNRVVSTAAPMTIVINKPPGYICTASDTDDRRTIFDLLPANFPRLFHVGRLDLESEGLLILTNDGDLSLKLTHPRYKVAKEYEVVLDHSFDFELVPKMLHGMSLEEGWAKAEAVYKLAPNKAKVVLRQGLKRQIRKMFYALGYEVNKLTRTRIGPLALGSMEPGSWRAVTQAEIDELLEEGRKHAEEQPEPAHAHAPYTHKPRRFEARGEASPRGPQSQSRGRFARESGGEGEQQRPRPYRPKREYGGDERPRREYGSRAPRQARDEREGGYGGERRWSKPPYERGNRGYSGDRGEAPRRGGYGGGPRRQGPVEEIPFVPRARRGEEAAEERPKRFGKSFGKPQADKPWLRKKHKEQRASSARQPGKPKKHPFAKFQRKQRDF